MIRPPLTLASTALAAAIALSCVAQAAPTPARSTLLPGDPVRGKLVYGRRCSGCHTLVRNGEGPRHLHVYGARAGTAPDYSYSEPLAESGIVWNEANLDRWLADPQAVVPGSAMAYETRSARDRADIIAYLKSFSQPGRK